MFEFDANKSLSNKVKHGIDFYEAQALWNDKDAVEIIANASEDELRQMIIGKIDSKHYSAVVTYRGDAVRIISVRRSREKEAMIYDSQRI
ncbi:toxin [Clostridia bacterium]|nr:toxin [Clostridia bacterium]